MEDGAFAFLAVLLLQERNLVADAEFDELSDMQVGLCACLKVDIVPHTVLHTEADVVEGLIHAGSFILIEQRTLAITVYRMVAIIIVT